MGIKCNRTIDYVRKMISDILSRNRISFYSGSSRMTEESKESLNDIIKYINSLTGDKEIIISGYTDASGSRAKNRELSLMRAKAVERYLRLNGLIKPYKIETMGYGEDYLIDDKNPYSPIIEGWIDLREIVCRDSSEMVFCLVYWLF